MQTIRQKISLQKLIATGYLRSLYMHEEEMNEPIDFVVKWVDGNDPAWREDKAKYTPDYEKGNTEARFREWNQFMYWFRAVEKYAPWVRYVHLVTWGHLPPWINTNHPKLRIVKHSDFIPKEYLPTFSSNAIELSLHLIPDLSEHFVCFDDDMYLTKPVYPSDFYAAGLPKYCALAIPVRNYRYNGPFAHQRFSDIGLVNGAFDTWETIRKSPELWFNHVYGEDRWYNINAYKDAYLPGMFFSHLACPLRKSTFIAAWKEFEPELHETSGNRFRTPMDFLYEVFSLWEIMSGTFAPVRKDHYGVVFGALSREMPQIAEAFYSKKHKMICLNDSVDVTEENFEAIKAELDCILERAYPQKSAFEI